MSITVSNKIVVGKKLTAGDAYPWISDRGDGSYRNPIIYADYSDPDVVRVGDNFYLVASSFNCTPGLPILHSKDLVNWTIINHAVKNLPHARYATVQPGCGVWAPAMRFHAGNFWVFFPMPDEGIYLTTASDPAGKWSEPHLVQEGSGLIDPCPFWDEDGQAYLVHAYANSRAGIKNMLRVRPMAPDGSRLLSEGKIVFHEPVKHPIIEGPKFLKKDGWYYILAPAGGVETGWQVALRSRNIYGPYEDKIVLEQGNTAINGPHQGALVDTINGDWWFVHFQDADVYGRIVHLQPVRWQDGWPMMGLIGQRGNQPVLHHSKPVCSGNSHLATPQTSDDFDSPTLGLQWQWNANSRHDWFSLDAHKGSLRLSPQSHPLDDLSRSPNLLLQKFPARAFSVETQLRFHPSKAGEQAGLIVTGQSSAALGLEHESTQTRLVLRIDGKQVFIKNEVPNTIKLRVVVEDGGLCRFSFAIVDGDFETIPHTFLAQKGVWIGARIGLFSQKRLDAIGSGYADFDHFRLAP